MNHYNGSYNPEFEFGNDHSYLNLIDRQIDRQIDRLKIKSYIELKIHNVLMPIVHLIHETAENQKLK